MSRQGSTRVLLLSPVKTVVIAPANIEYVKLLFCRSRSANESGGPIPQPMIGVSERISRARRGVSRDGLGLVVGWMCSRRDTSRGNLCTKRMLTERYYDEARKSN